MVADMGRGIIDTIFFDSYGNCIRVSSFGRIQLLKEWDEHHRVIRQADLGEFPAYYICSYDTMDKFYVEKMRLMSAIDWDNKLDSLYERDVYWLLFRLDDSGKITEKIDTTLNHTITKYSYEDGKLIEKRDTFLLGDEGYVKRWSYSYNDGILVRIDFYWGGVLNTIDYFDDRGLIKYSVRRGKPEHPFDTVKYCFAYDSLVSVKFMDSKDFE